MSDQNRQVPAGDQTESNWACFWCGSMQAHETGYPGGMSTVPACAAHAAEHPLAKAFPVQAAYDARQIPPEALPKCTCGFAEGDGNVAPVDDPYCPKCHPRAADVLPCGWCITSVDCPRHPMSSLEEEAMIPPKSWRVEEQRSAEDQPDAQRMASHSAFMTGLGPASRYPGDEHTAWMACDWLLTRIGSWTNARWDQHLRDRYGDEKADRIIALLGYDLAPAGEAPLPGVELRRASALPLAVVEARFAELTAERDMWKNIARGRDTGSPLPSIRETTFQQALEHIRNHLEDDASNVDLAWVLTVARNVLGAMPCAGLGQTSGGNGATGLEPEALPSSTTTPARGPEEAGTFPDCGCTDGTAADEPADRGFICPHDPAGHSSCADCGFDGRRKHPNEAYDACLYRDANTGRIYCGEHADRRQLGNDAVEISGPDPIDPRDEVLSRLSAWTFEYGEALKPTGADTYGEGVRACKGQVARILATLTKSVAKETP